MYKSSLIAEIGGFDPRTTSYEDIDICFKILALPKTNVVIIKENCSIFNDDNDPNRIMAGWKSDKGIQALLQLSKNMLNNSTVNNEFISYLYTVNFYIRNVCDIPKILTKSYSLCNELKYVFTKKPFEYHFMIIVWIYEMHLVGYFVAKSFIKSLLIKSI